MQQLAMGTTSSIVLCNGGSDVFVCGTNNGKSLPLAHPDNCVKTPVNVSHTIWNRNANTRLRATQVSARGVLMGVVDSDGTAHCIDDEGTFAKIDTLGIKHGVSQIACGRRHWALLSTAGQVYTVGSSFLCGLGHGDDKPICSPKLVEALQHEVVTQLECAHICSAVTESGKVFFWGHQCQWVLGGSRSRASLLSPRQMHAEYLFNGKVIQVSCGRSHALALLAGGQLLSWGWNGYGQLGNGQTGTFEWLPGRIDIPGIAPTSTLKIRCGTSTSFAISDCGDLYSCGSGANMVLGTGFDQGEARAYVSTTETMPCHSRFTYVDVEGCIVVDVDTSEFKTGVVTDDGRLYTWGHSSDHRQEGKYRRSRRILGMYPKTTGIFHDTIDVIATPRLVWPEYFNSKPVGTSPFTFLTIKKKIAFMMGMMPRRRKQRRCRKTSVCAILPEEVVRFIFQVYHW